MSRHLVVLDSFELEEFKRGRRVVRSFRRGETVAEADPAFDDLSRGPWVSVRSGPAPRSKPRPALRDYLTGIDYLAEV